MLAKSREARKHLRKLGMVRKAVAAHRLKELRHLHTVENIATWRRAYGFGRLEDGDDNWVHDPLPPKPEQITASMWPDLNALKDATSLSGKDGSRQKVKSFINEVGQGAVSFTDEEFARLKRFVERRGRHAAYVTVAPIDTALPCSPLSRSSEISFVVCVCMERNDERRMDPEPDQIESSSADTDFETPGQQCLPKWETGRTTADGCLLVAVGSNFGGNTFPLDEIAVGRRDDSKITTPPTASTPVFPQESRKP